MVKLPNLTKRQWAAGFVIALADFCSAVCVSLQAPFYPAEAEKKGATASQYGLVFGVFELVVFFISPIYGKYLPKLRPKFMFNIGLFVTGFCSILFGILDKVESTNIFIGLSFTVRIVEALGNAAFLTASFAIVAAEFPNSVATTFACLETFFGLGLIVGPTLGGALYQVGGYILPFTFLGAILFSAAFVSYTVLPTNEYRGRHADGGLFKILRIPPVLLAMSSVLGASISIGFLSATLEPHLRQFNLSPIVMGVMFVIEGGVYAVTAPIWGYLCDTKLQPKTVTLMGTVFIIVGFILVGPAPFLPLDTTLALAVIGLVIMGFGVGAELVSGFVSALQEATFHGFSNNLSTYGLVSGLWTSTFALGAFIGPSVAGVLFDHYGFRFGTLFVIAAHLLLAFIVSVFMCFEQRLPLGTLSAPKDYSTFSENADISNSIKHVSRTLSSSLKQDVMPVKWSPTTDI